MVIRRATTQDISLLIKLRLDFLNAVTGELTQNDEEAISLQLKRYFEKHLNDDTFFAIIAEIDDKAVSTAYLAISEIPANPDYITGKSGKLLNVWTYPEYRRKGFAAKVLLFLIDEARRAGVSSIDLYSTPNGRPLYKKLGFIRLKETPMRINLV